MEKKGKILAVAARGEPYMIILSREHKTPCTSILVSPFIKKYLSNTIPARNHTSTNHVSKKVFAC